MEPNGWHYDYVRLAWDAGFCFEDRRARTNLDFSALSLVDVEKVVVNRDVATIEKHTPTILRFSLDEELKKILEPNFVKIFQLAQLSIQYLLFCKNYLDKTVTVLKEEIANQKKVRFYIFFSRIWGKHTTEMSEEY